MKKIMFNDHYGLTRAVITGRKKMTRRVEKNLESIIADYERDCGEPFKIIFQKWDNVTSTLSVFTPHGMVTVDTRYKLGEVVAVAQAYKDVFDIVPYRDYLLAYYRYDESWTNKLFTRAGLMPYQTKITGVMIERLQDISYEDCLKEGIEYSRREKNWFYKNDKCTKFYATSPYLAFASLINRPNVGHVGIWEENPFVVVYGFLCYKAF